MKRSICSLFVLLSLFSCNNNDNNDTNGTAEKAILPEVDGLAVTLSTNSFNDTYSKIKTTLFGNDKIGIVAEVDHSANASGVSLDLPSTKVVLFGNPELGTPLMQENQLAGLDLPQKVLVYQQDNYVFVAYNSAEYLAKRHNLTKSDPQLEKIAMALKDITSSGTVTEPTLNKATVTSGEGIITVDSNNPFNSTYNKLKGAIEANTNLSIMAILDHQTNGASVGKVIRPTSLLVFGNPNLGTPLMQSSRTMAIDLPQKMLVWQDDAGITHISYNDPNYLAKRHAIVGNAETLSKIADALAGLSKAAAN